MAYDYRERRSHRHIGILTVFSEMDRGLQATLSGMFFTGLAAFVYFSLWFQPWAIMAGDIAGKTGFTLLTIACAVISGSAVWTKIQGSVTRDLKKNFLSSFIFGVFLVIIAVIILYLSAIGATAGDINLQLMAVYILISSIVSVIATYLLLSSLRPVRAGVR